MDFYLRSMTAYGRDTLHFAYGYLTVEAQSVNRRFLEVNVTMPRLLSRFEMDLRKLVGEGVGRGMVNLSISWQSRGEEMITVVPNLTLAKKMYAAFSEIAQELGLEAHLDLSLLTKEKDILSFEESIPDEELFLQALQTTLSRALDQLTLMKEKEGRELARDLDERISLIGQHLDPIKKHAPDVVERYRKKLTERLEAFASFKEENEERILKEIALYAERMDITEEIVRFQMHLAQFRQILQKPFESRVQTRGKTLEFLLQELGREINTIGSKALEATIAQHVIVIKSELEKIKEQVQNIE